MPLMVPRSLPPPRIPPLPRDMALREHFGRLRAEALGRVDAGRRSENSLTRKKKHLANMERRAVVGKALRVVLGDATMNQVAIQARLPRSAVWRVMMGRLGPSFRNYLKISRAIQRLNPGVHRETIDRHIMRVLRHPLP